jgi:hypothetical protein
LFCDILKYILQSFTQCCILFSGRTEVLYHRSGFGEYLHTRQQGLSNGVGEASIIATVPGMNDIGESRVKGKKSKGKK